MKGGSQLLLQILQSSGEIQVNKPEWHSGGEDCCKEVDGALWQVINHLGSHWDSHFLGEKCLSCILMTRRETAELRARESLLCRGRHVCTAQGWGWADRTEERCSAPGVRGERSLLRDVWWQGPRRRPVSELGLISEVMGSHEGALSWWVWQLGGDWIWSGCGWCEMRSGDRSKVSCSIAVERIDDASGLGPKVRGEEWRIGHEI